jgi:hypothetical protein
MKKWIAMGVMAGALVVPAGAQADAPHDGMRYCGTASYLGQVRAPESTTSCAFARSVAHSVMFEESYRAPLRWGERFRVHAYSRVTHRSYGMRCRVSWNVPVRINCYGGNGAHVRIVDAG